MFRNFAIASVVSAATIGTSWAFWQEAAPSRANPSAGPGGGSPTSFFFAGPDATVTLLKTPEVQKELKLEEDKAKKLDEISAEAARERVRLNAEYNAKMSELNKKSQADALALLSETQRRRTEQLKLQQQGVRAFSTAAVAEKLGLTQAQRDEIANLNRTSSSFGRDRTTNPDGQNTPAADRFQQLRESSSRRFAETREKILAVLTPEQKAKWSEMTGETFLFPSRSRSSSRDSSTRSSEPAKPGAEKKDQ